MHGRHRARALHAGVNADPDGDPDSTLSPNLPSPNPATRLSEHESATLRCVPSLSLQIAAQPRNQGCMSGPI